MAMPNYDYNIRSDERVEITRDNKVIGFIAEEVTEEFLNIMDFYYDSLVDDPAEKDDIEWVSSLHVQEFIEEFIRVPENFMEAKRREYISISSVQRLCENYGFVSGNLPMEVMTFRDKFAARRAALQLFNKINL